MAMLYHRARCQLKDRSINIGSIPAVPQRWPGAVCPRQNYSVSTKEAHQRRHHDEERGTLDRVKFPLRCPIHPVIFLAVPP